MSEVAGFYDAWAVDYDAAFADWAAAARAQGGFLASALRDRGIGPGARVLDCTCGIGTQVIGLGIEGYRMYGSDLSLAEIERARVEAARLGVSADFETADVLDLRATLPADWSDFDAVVTANSLTHMAEPETLIGALAQMAGVCRPGGIVAVTNRDYDSIGQPSSTPVQRSTSAGVQRISFQLWDWAADGRSYRMEDMLLTRPESSVDGEWSIRSRSTRLHAWRRADVEHAAAEAGLRDVRWLETAWQPIATFAVP